MATLPDKKFASRVPDKEASGVTNRSNTTDDLEAKFLFEYRDLSLPRTFRFVENRGRFWIGSYVVPLIFVVAGWLVWRISAHYQWETNRLTPATLAVATLGLSTSSAIVLALVSIARGESNSYRAYQPLISAFLVILFATVWVIYYRN